MEQFFICLKVDFIFVDFVDVMLGCRGMQKFDYGVMDFFFKLVCWIFEEVGVDDFFWDFIFSVFDSIDSFEYRFNCNFWG